MAKPLCSNCWEREALENHARCEICQYQFEQVIKVIMENQQELSDGDTYGDTLAKVLNRESKKQREKFKEDNK